MKNYTKQIIEDVAFINESKDKLRRKWGVKFIENMVRRAYLEGKIDGIKEVRKALNK